MVRVGISFYYNPFDFRHVAGRVAMRCIGQIRVADILLREDSEINARPKSILNGVDVWRVSIGRDLRAIHDAGTKIESERFRILDAALADNVTQNRLLI